MGDKIKPKQKAYILEKQKEWISKAKAKKGKIPPSMKKFFKKQKLNKKLAKEILSGQYVELKADLKVEPKVANLKEIERKTTMQILLSKHDAVPEVASIKKEEEKETKKDDPEKKETKLSENKVDEVEETKSTPASVAEVVTVVETEPATEKIPTSTKS